MGDGSGVGSGARVGSGVGAGASVGGGGEVGSGVGVGGSAVGASVGGKGVGVAEGSVVAVCVGVFVSLGVSVGSGVGVGSGVAVAVGVSVVLGVSVGSGEFVGVSGDFVGDRSIVGVAVGADGSASDPPQASPTKTSAMVATAMARALFCIFIVHLPALKYTARKGHQRLQSHCSFLPRHSIESMVCLHEGPYPFVNLR